MSNQATVNGANHRTVPVFRQTGSSRALVGNAAEVLHDITELAELQVRLLAADVKSIGYRSWMPLGSLTLGLCMLLGLIPVVLMAIAELLIEFAELSRATALLSVGGLGLLFAGMLIVVGWRTMRKRLCEIENTTTELKRNISWIKKTLKNNQATTYR